MDYFLAGKDHLTDSFGDQPQLVAVCNQSA